ncbi:dicarboxylate/amino acid:cation symporter [Marinicella gelatinilytica]|uniref:dicarboxylate/amino acid:cation symporter n=1 Tax=Marinicella gelatinilytica TaxID=2996017 RepID=UPI002260FA3F|nr:dicarboxylate/amino acid:cation symporter [Marinicella gelatinilytica]MCX7544935.1 dicarboxylate/amino acid:cation symporter [Marinicella gelatinilytica]
MNLTRKIIIYMIIGAVIGIALNVTNLKSVGFIDDYVINGLFYIVGQLFILSLKMMVVPLVFVSLFCGTTALREPAMLGSLGGRTLAFYLFTTATAITIALTLAITFGVGSGAEIPTDVNYVAAEGRSFTEVILSILDNPVQAMADGNMLAIIIFAILLGYSAGKAGDAGQKVISFFKDFNEVIMKLVMVIMEFAPIAVLAILAKVFAELGFDAVLALGGYFFTVLIVLFVHALVVYPTLLKVLSGLSPRIFFSKMRSTLSFAFGTSSSNATIPVTYKTVTERLGVENSVASFSVPFGATINMDGTSIMQGVATVFIANAYGLDLTGGQLVTVVLMATMASIGTAGVPSAGLVMLQGVLLQVGLPIEGIGIILGVDRLLDMTRTAVNVTGDATVTCIVAKSIGKFDEDVYNDPNAGEEMLE